MFERMRRENELREMQKQSEAAAAAARPPSPRLARYVPGAATAAAAARAAAPGFLGNWTATYQLLNGGFVTHTPTRVFGKNVLMSFSVNCTQKAFEANLRKSGLID